MLKGRNTLISQNSYLQNLSGGKEQDKAVCMLITDIFGGSSLATVLSGVLSQEGHPIAFISYTFSQAQQNWSNRKKGLCRGMVHGQTAAFPSSKAVLYGNRSPVFKNPVHEGFKCILTCLTKK